ncbi:GNAT family N-acetyltransferase [Flavobacterium sp. 3HN19-14]|uniref:GNAT family N-acetyltransferase n=1 Tax=Flavobacterium sp. 3HN19-14 TaxID=3448133 RepID=UPI003EE10671
MNSIITERLILRPLTISDVDDFFLMNNNPNVNAYLRNPITTKAEAKQYIQKIISEYERNNIARFGVILKATNRLIGFSGLKYRNTLENNHIDFYDLGYRFSEKQWRKGFATEAALAWLDYGFNTMQLSKIHACAVRDNIASNSVLKKIGFTFMNQYSVNNELHNWYTIKKQNFKP